MPGVIVQSNSSSTGPGFRSSQSSSNSVQHPITSPYDGLSVADVKQKAIDSVNKEARGISALALIKTARTQILSAKEHEAKGDLRGALGTYIKAAKLSKMAMDSPEYMQEKGAGVIKKELNDLLQTEGKDISARTNAVEEKLKAVEKAQAHFPESKGLPTSISIQDRLRALQDNGLSIEQQPLRTTRELPSPLISARNHQLSHQTSPIPSPSTVASSSSSSATNPPSKHVFVSPTTLGPPSPPSPLSPSNGTYLNNDDLNGFNRAFPSVDELDNDPTFALPSVPLTPPVHNSNALPTTKLKISKDSPQLFQSTEQPISPLPFFRNFAAPIERPSSTPITPINNAFANSRPPSPIVTKLAASHVPSRLSGVVNGVSSAIPSANKAPLPVKNIASPTDLLTYLRDYNVLLIDVRHRAEFDKEHIRADAVVCMEPSVLLREGVSAESLENAMIVGPRQEASLFAHRDKFDLVAIYDSSSSSFGSESEVSPMSVLFRVIFEQAFKKMLKRMPMLLVGGIQAWKKEFGSSELIRGPGYRSEAEVLKPAPMSSSSSALRGSVSGGTNGCQEHPPFANGMANTMVPYSNGTSSTPSDLYATKSGIQVGHHVTTSTDQPGHSRSPADAVYSGSYVSSSNGLLTRRPAFVRPSLNSASFTRSISELATSPFPNSGGVTPTSPISYPHFHRHISPNTSGSGLVSTNTSSQSLQPTTFSSSPAHYSITSPPQASINPSQLSSRKRNDFVDQSQEALSNLSSVKSPTGLGTSVNTGSIGIGIDYPELNSPPLVRPPPPVAAPSLSERQANRSRQTPYVSSANGMHVNGAPKPPRINSDYPVSFWSDIQIGISGLKNLGNTCYMNAPIQCLSATVPFARFFTDGRWKHAINYTNPLSSKGKLTGAFAKLLHDMWGGDLPYLTPLDFRRSICSLNSQYNGSYQHDSQEFLSFLIDGIHEDLNRIIVKPTHTPTPEEEAQLEKLPPQIASDREWRVWQSRNDSLIVDYFQGQFRNRLECLTCHKTSTTYNVFSILSLPIPQTRSGKIAIQHCLDAFFNEEVLEKDDAWDCPQCKTKVRASKKLSLARLPPVLMIHFKRFEANGRFSDKIDTFVEFPTRSLDLTNYMHRLLPPGADKSEPNGGPPLSLEDPRTQLPPYRYDLYGVTNHYGNLSSGHYTAFIASRGRWFLCDDSSIKEVDSKRVVNQKAYVLFYKRVRN